MRKREKKGVTLMELLTTVAIITILVGISISAYVWAVPWVKGKLGFIIQFGDPVKKIKAP